MRYLSNHIPFRCTNSVWNFRKHNIVFWSRSIFVVASTWFSWNVWRVRRIKTNFQKEKKLSKIDFLPAIKWICIKYYWWNCWSRGCRSCGRCGCWWQNAFVKILNFKIRTISIFSVIIVAMKSKHNVYSNKISHAFTTLARWNLKKIGSVLVLFPIFEDDCYLIALRSCHLNDWSQYFMRLWSLMLSR